MSLIDSLEVGVGVAFIHGRSRLKSRVERVRVESVGRQEPPMSRDDSLVVVHSLCSCNIH